jgi:CRP-like cAMP-binding protein
MAINETFLHSIEATEEQYKIGDFIFKEGSIPEFYYQIVTGEVKLNRFADDGKEFIQNIFTDRSSIGESMLILEKPYPMNAIALKPCKILKVSRTHFFHLLREHRNIFEDIYNALADNVFEKQSLMRVITTESVENRIIEIMDLLKESHVNKDKFCFEIPHTRHQLASLTGLSLQTTIRTIKKLEEKNIVMIKNQKIFY